MEERAAATVPAAFPLAAEDAADLPSRVAADREVAQLRRLWAERMAGRGVSILIRCIEQGGDAVHELVPYELLGGESVLRLPDADT